MHNEHDNASARQERFEEILVALVEASESGNTLDLGELRAKYPEFADELADFFTGRKHLGALAKPLRQAASCASPASPPIGTRVRYFGDYELLEEIARGGMGVVYRARQVSLQRIVALKMILAGQLASETDRQRFHQEAEAAANLDHPNIVPIYEVGEHEGQHYFSMKLIMGGSLAQAIAGGAPITQVQAARLLAEVARAVHHAHQRGVLHRDLKPANILMSGEGGGARDDQSPLSSRLSSLVPMITDFGLAKRIEADSKQTHSGAVVGTPAYMAPEQARADKNVSVAADVYSLGAILYELLTGRPPFQATTPAEMFMQVLEQPPKPPRSLKATINRDLETISLKCLAKESGKRYRSAEALAEDLERWLAGEPIKARPSSVLERGMKWVKRRPAAAAFIVTAVLFFGAMLATALVFLQQHEALRAEQAEAKAQTQVANAQTQLANVRHFQSLVGQANTERLTGNRARALQLLAEAARLETSPEVRRDAIHAVTSPGLRLLHEIPVGFVNSMKFSPDGAILAVHGVFGARPGEMSDQEPEESQKQKQRLKVWRMPSGAPMGETYLRAYTHGANVGHSSYWPEKLNRYLPFLLSPQSPCILLADENGQKLRLWDPVKSRMIAELDAPFRDVAFSPDGRRLATPTKNTLRQESQIWDIEKTVAGPPFKADIPVAFLSENELIACSFTGNGYRLKRIDVTTGKELSATPPGTDVLSISDDGRTAAICQSDAKTADPVRIWDAVDGKELAIIPAAVPLGKIPFGAVFSPDGRYFAIDDPMRPTSFKLWDRANRRLRDAISGTVYGEGTFNMFQRASFSPNAALLVCYGQKERNILHLWDVRGERRVATLRDNHSPVWSGDGRLLATIAPGKIRGMNGKEYGDDRTFVRVWEVIYPVPATNLGVPLETLEFREGDELLANNRTLKIEPSPAQPTLVPSPYRLEDRGMLVQAKKQLWAVEARFGFAKNDVPLKLVQVAPPGEELILAMPAIKREPTDRKEYEPIATPIKNAWAIDSKRRRLVAACRIYGVQNPAPGAWSATSFGSDDWLLTAWDLHTGAIQLIGDRHPEMQTLAIDPTGTVAATGNRDGVTFWDLDTLKKRQSVSNRITSSQVLDNWSQRGGTELPFEYSFPVLSLRFSPDGRRLFTAGAGGRIDVYDVATAKIIGAWEGHRGRVFAVALSPDGLMLASGGEDRTIRLWATATGKELARWDAHDEGVTALAFGANGQSLASGGGDGSVKLWDLAFVWRELKTLGLDW
jgi:WD40 repeat protein/tRNA A-37 threonylcarbamoyl transferase component Bud32